MTIPSGLYAISDCHGAGKPTLEALASGERRGAALGDGMMKFEFSSVMGVHVVFFKRFVPRALGVWVFGYVRDLSRQTPTTMIHRRRTDRSTPDIFLDNHRTPAGLQVVHANAGSAARPPSCALGGTRAGLPIDIRNNDARHHPLRFPAAVARRNSHSQAAGLFYVDNSSSYAFFYARLGILVPEGRPPARQPRFAGVEACGEADVLCPLFVKDSDPASNKSQAGSLRYGQRWRMRSQGKLDDAEAGYAALAGRGKTLRAATNCLPSSSAAAVSRNHEPSRA